MDNAELQREFGLRVQQLRKKRGLTQEQLAERVERTVDTISNIERGFSSTRVETAYAIARELGSSLAELFDFNGAIELDRERRGRYLNLLEMLRPLDIEMLEAATAQLEILLRARQRAFAGGTPAGGRKKRK
jgi:transcriptional regulator with XRE-family HTH domain